MRAVWQVASGVLSGVPERNLDLIAAGVAFYAMLAMFPGVAALIALFGMMADPDLIQDQVIFLKAFLPPEAYALLNTQLTRLIAARDSTLGLTTVLSSGIALWSTRAAVGALTRGLNAAYGTSPRAGVRGLFWSLFLTAALVAVSLAALVSIVVAPIVLKIFPQGRLYEAILLVSNWTLVGAITMGMIGLIYRYAPNHPGRRPRWLSAGAVLAMVIWAAASAVFSLYLRNFGSYNEIYGSIGAVIALLMWLFISAFSVLLGAAVNAEIEIAHPVERPRRFERFRRDRG
jgi:membrane protein